MDYRTLAKHLTEFITERELIAALWDGNLPGSTEDMAHTASELIELAQPLLDQLRSLIANEDFVPQARQHEA